MKQKKPLQIDNMTKIIVTTIISIQINTHTHIASNQLTPTNTSLHINTPDKIDNAMCSHHDTLVGLLPILHQILYKIIHAGLSQQSRYAHHYLSHSIDSHCQHFSGASLSDEVMRDCLDHRSQFFRRYQVMTSLNQVSQNLGHFLLMRI